MGTALVILIIIFAILIVIRYVHCARSVGYSTRGSMVFDRRPEEIADTGATDEPEIALISSQASTATPASESTIEPTPEAEVIEPR